MFSVIYKAIGDRQARQAQTKKYKRIVNAYFKDSGINKGEATRFVNYLTYAFEKKNAIDNQYLDDLAPKLKHTFI